jgi:hypothetical protein
LQQINVVELLCDAMYSNHAPILDALADLMEFMVDQQYSSPPIPSRPRHNNEDMIDENDILSTSSIALVSPRRFQQTRIIMGVEDEVSFQANISTRQLYSIESKELLGILQELASAIALQRFRFVDRLVAADSNNNSDNDYGVCHCLARILTAVCRGYAKVVHSIQWMDQQNHQQQGQGDNGGAITAASILQHYIPSSAAGGCLDFLGKCCGPQQPSVTICAMVLPIVTPLLRTEVGLAVQWLPLLQRRAIIPHQIRVIDEEEGQLKQTSFSLSSAYETSGMDYHEFVHQFRTTVLKDALLGCYHSHSDYYLASCTAAVEEFCDDRSSTTAVADPTSSSERTALHLEAALYCMSEVADQRLLDMLSSASTSLLARDSNDNDAQVVSSTSSDLITCHKVGECLQRCTVALAHKPYCLSNLLTSKQACHFVRKVRPRSQSKMSFFFGLKLTFH